MSLKSHDNGISSHFLFVYMTSLLFPVAALARCLSVLSSENCNQENASVNSHILSNRVLSRCSFAMILTNLTWNIS